MSDEPAEEGQVRRDSVDFGLGEGAASLSSASSACRPWATSFAIIGS